MSEFVPTPSERMAAALERIAAALERIDQRQDAELRERYQQIYDNGRYAERGTSAHDAIVRFERVHADAIRRWEREATKVERTAVAP